MTPTAYRDALNPGKNEQRKPCQQHQIQHPPENSRPVGRRHPHKELEPVHRAALYNRESVNDRRTSVTYFAVSILHVFRLDLPGL